MGSSNHIRHERGAKWDVVALEKNNTMIYLHDWERTTRALMKNSITTRLNRRLRNSDIGFQGADRIAVALEKDIPITTLDLRDNCIGDEGADRIAVALVKNITVTTLDFGNNSIGAQGAERIGVALGNNSALTILNLSHNRIGARGAE